MDEDSFDDLKEQVEANTKMIEGILSGLLDGEVKFELSESYDKYLGKGIRSTYGTYSLDSKNGREGLTAGNVEAKVCFATGGKYNPKTGKCIHKKGDK